MIRCTLLFALLTFALCASWANPRVQVTENGGLLVDGKPFLPIFVWAQPSSALALHKSLGVNTLHPGESEAKDPLQPYLDALQANGMLALVGSEAYRDALRDHPAILAWTVEHEPDTAVAAAYAPDLSKDPGAIWIEGESAAATNFTSSPWLAQPSEHLSGGKWLALDRTGDAFARYTFTVKTAAAYTLWSREFNKSWANPTSWQLDDGAVQQTPRSLSSEEVVDMGNGRGVGWCKYGAVTLTAGAHTLTIKVLPGRTAGAADQTSANETICALDAFCFTTMEHYPPARPNALEPRRKPEMEQATYQLMKRRDPHCLTWNILSSGFYGPFKQLATEYYQGWLRWADVTSFDHYPITGWNQPAWLPQVGLATKELVSLARKNQPVFAIVEASDQQLSWTAPETKGPSPAEMRAEIWSAIANGARGIGYFTIAFGRGKTFQWNNLTEEIKAEMKRSNGELSELAGPIELGATARLPIDQDQTTDRFAAGHAIQAICKTYQGTSYLIAVNVTRQPIDPIFHLPGTGAQVLHENREITVTDGQFTDHFAPLEVHLYVVKD